MSSIAAGNLKANNGGNAARVAPGGVLLTTQGAVIIVVLGAAVVWAFWGFFDRQNRISASGQDWSHAYLVPLISGYLAWQNRREIAATKPRIFWPGLIPLALSIPCYVLFQLGSLSTHMGQGWAMILAVFGLCLLLTGPRMMQLLFLPVCYLVFGVTVAEMVMIKLTFALQAVAAQGGGIVLNLIGVNTDVVGNELNITTKTGEHIPLNIAEACSGMRMVIAFAALSVVVALAGLKHWWQRIALMLLGLPVAVIMNVLRVAVLGVASLSNREFAKGQAHMFIGFVLLVVAFFVFMGIAELLKRTVQEPKVKLPPAPIPFKAGRVEPRMMLRPAFITAFSLLIGTALGITAVLHALGIFLTKKEIQAPGNRSVAMLPVETDNWVLVGPANETMSGEMVEELGTHNYLMRVYQQKNPEPGKPRIAVQLHLAYYTGMIDTVPHVPDRCMTAHGMQPVTLAEELPVTLDRSTWRPDDNPPTGWAGAPVFTGRTGKYSDRPNLRVRLPRGIEDLHMRFSTFDPKADSGSRAGERTVAGYFFMANGGLTPSPEGVRVLAFKLQDDYAYYLKVQTTMAGAIDAAYAAKISGQLISELMPEIARCAPDWVEVESGEYPPDNPHKGKKP
ncbi:MAG: exosortase/archaeosortase family protein [Phycisphaerales bacterium]